MKLALLLPGYLDSPDYLHMRVIENRLNKIGYTTKRIDPCDLWKTGEVDEYNLTNYLKNIQDIIDFYKHQNLEEVVLVGHSFGGAVAIIAGSRYQEVLKVIALCPAVSFNKSDNKWNENGKRFSKRDLPNDPSKFREFNIPMSFVKDRNKYSISDSLKKLNKPLMVLIAMKDDKVLPEEIEIALKNIHNPCVIKMENMGHNFRGSIKEVDIVADKIEKFLVN